MGDFISHLEYIYIYIYIYICIYYIDDIEQLDVRSVDI